MTEVRGRGYLPAVIGQQASPLPSHSEATSPSPFGPCDDRAHREAVVKEAPSSTLPAEALRDGSRHQSGSVSGSRHLVHRPVVPVHVREEAEPTPWVLLDL